MKKRLFLKVVLLLSCLFAPGTLPAKGTAVVSTGHATVTLLSEQVKAVPGQTLWLALRFELIPHWHIYWRNPGASGSAPLIRWTLPSRLGGRRDTVAGAQAHTGRAADQLWL